ncbi:hypothetical protein K432DRAFT_69664 [Lepidopterella palustris CBS 459.81]|uniref:C2H2-type domain-containing protein n=1 Tax=Lepidopterella palustris CBS 459.81 TaxID=1314670 RepID=A0A8E2E923_9PEZI|nr:hypothetical protein K432DRAFT_69664 [Lepidopterella palustris CBS 459.81]
MLSNNTPSGIQRRRTQHRRQNSTPAIFEAPKVRPLPANIQRHNRNRTGMSLDLKGLNLETILTPERGLFPDRMPTTPTNTEPFQQDDSTVSITNPGQSQQHCMQVAQTHSTAQPGPQYDFSQPSPQSHLPPSPRTPQRSLHQQPQPSVPVPPTEQQLKELHDHIHSVYGQYGQVFVNILPTPIATPTKPARLPSHEPLDTAPMPSNFSDMAEITLEPPGSELNFTFENPESDMGYESSSYYTSDALSPGRSPCSSPQQKSFKTFLEDVEEHPSQLPFSNAPSFFPSSRSTSNLDDLPAPYTDSIPRSMSIADLDVDASIEYTGIAPEDVQRFISEQDPINNRWSCLYPGCDKTFGRRENIRSHVQTHLGDRQFRCNGCGKCFVRQHDLKRHAKIHSGNKPYKCPCGAGFARQDALTRHRQRGMCIGGFPDAVRRQAKRGRPKKNRPDMEERTKKASRTRQALASAASSSYGGSPLSNGNSPHAQSPLPVNALDFIDTTGAAHAISGSDSFENPLSTSADPFSPFTNTSSANNDSFKSSSPFEDDETSMKLFRQLSAEGFTQTPPMSPANSESSAGDDQNNAPFDQAIKEESSALSRSSMQSNQFTTPPTSPAEPVHDDLDELFNSFPDTDSCSQYDLEMKAMNEFTSFDSSPYELLDFM